ncbi:sugar O-acetyltransferase [Maribacter cobaltidurans]|uniref:Acetyltransferase n=1 Tax=Maribacter cobaltidurans TaxID=1178778 RepID=A0A223VD12_9FLAO|nr:sugar O-acetyltransferase [Maribacter cobaltidurans]ASV32719.1 maltose acetyltransferase [Maribacter cobaltidurans]GGD82404.1 maltose O-acetyltransferase [Maribacter cobaltidurans]
MTEREKMLQGKDYDSRDPELLKQYFFARELLKKYNNLDAHLLEAKQEILFELFQYVGKGVWIEAPFFCDYGNNLSIGDGTFVNMNCAFLDNNKISIGKNVLIGPYVQIYTASHPLKASERIVERNDGASYLTSSKPVKIGNKAWIGGNSVICPGVTIGDNVTIGAGSVVTKNIPDNTLAFGNPCKIIREL